MKNMTPKEPKTRCHHLGSPVNCQTMAQLIAVKIKAARAMAAIMLHLVKSKEVVALKPATAKTQIRVLKMQVQMISRLYCSVSVERARDRDSVCKQIPIRVIFPLSLRDQQPLTRIPSKM